jgi:small-conductance mechanosensitive channel
MTTSSPDADAKSVRHRLYGAAFVGAAALHYALRLGLIPIPAAYAPAARRIVVGVMGVLLVLGLARLVAIKLIDPLKDPVSRYNLRRIENLVVALIVALIVVSVLFANWYPAVVSLGLISLVLGFALQTPISSFIGWIYILIRKPYRIGDRIKISDATGDVIDVGYLDTTLAEFGGDYLSTDLPSGRVIKFPNSLVLNATVFNYSWSFEPFLWNELSVHVAYDADLAFVESTLKAAAAAVVGPAMRERVQRYRQMLQASPVEGLNVADEPVTIVRANANTWIEVLVRYLVDPKRASAVKTEILTSALARLNAAPDRVRFPKGDAR